MTYSNEIKMRISSANISLFAFVMSFSTGCSPFPQSSLGPQSSIENNPNLVSVVGTNETGYQYIFLNGRVCNKPPYYTKYVKTGGAVAIKSLFEVRGDFESDWKKTAEASPKFQELQSVFFDICFENGNGFIDDATYEERSNKYDRIRQKVLEQGLSQDPERDIRFEVRLAETKFFQLKKKRKVEFSWKFEPTVEDPNKAITVFLGLTVLHDEDKVSGTDNIDKSCPEVDSCLHFQFWDKRTDPIIIRGGRSANDVSWIVEIPNNVQTIRVFWEFYQLEADMGNKCHIVQQNPKGGIPFLEVISPSGKTMDGGCYYSRGFKILKVAI